MVHNYNPDITPLVLHFYARCFLFPYEEMSYELQHIFRQIETMIDNEGDTLCGYDILSVINTFQGEEIHDLRADYVLLFSARGGSKPVCPILAGEFTSRFGIDYDPDPFINLFYDSDLLPGDDDYVDSVVNYLEYYAYLYSTGHFESSPFPEIEIFFNNHILVWIPQFCDFLSKSANISFYRELALSLKAYLLSGPGEF